MRTPSDVSRQDAANQAYHQPPSRATICIALADASCQPLQDPALLDTADRQRCARSPWLATRPDWRASRFLKQCHQPVADTPDSRSLSHSRGHAALAIRSPAGIIGVDLEKIRVRNFVALLPQFATDDEVQWWQAQAQPAEAFHRLWTIKEALLKASGLDFPGDLRRVGLRHDPDSRRWQLHVAPSSVPPGPGERNPGRRASGTSQATMSCTKDMYASAPAARAGTISPGDAGDAQGGFSRSDVTDGTRHWQGVSAVLNGQWLLACVWLAAGERPALRWEPHGNWRIENVVYF
ncbi:MAG: 4'-phosphopantetheinyl transferase superfamily protein [Lautropia sp.]|nr:4'-phosphopantetheinyl transferase superfamily protein [Lautropia sp.]